MKLERVVATALACLLAGCSHLVILHDPLSAAEHNDLGLSYERQGELDRAASEYRRSLSHDPRYAIARVNLGNVHAHAGRWAEAEQCYRRALRDHPDDADAMNNLATALLAQHKQPDEAWLLAARANLHGGAPDSVYRVTLNEAEAALRARDAAAGRTR